MLQSQPLLCVPLQVRTQKEVLKKWKALKGKTDLVELWLDSIQDLNLRSLLRQKPLPVICRGKRALEAGKLGADYVDIPYSMSFRVKRGISPKLILSYHNFKKTPFRAILLKKAQAMKKRGADIVKIAVQARTLDDCLSVILLAQELQHLKIPHILIAMGPLGRLSRILTPHVGGTMMFAPIKKSEATAEGQLTVKELRKAWSLIESAS